MNYPKTRIQWAEAAAKAITESTGSVKIIKIEPKSHNSGDWFSVCEFDKDREDGEGGYTMVTLCVTVPFES
jgi:hypothetical protein